ncbi:hypothetical protein PGTUg99_016442 [Puccinia graminis f. sp. tritici]|uniref:Uncharacterized protein n=1 Tax=Puccinia graminis f. sp. tritici TaxID=56615 RepID=A0A5B0RXY4_PUCGR|nr:hypothetical protein PGTUg99_016442 [Puccinia graminis f. sp. tritici]
MDPRKPIASLGTGPGSSDSTRNGPRTTLGSSSERPSDRPSTPTTPQAVGSHSDRPQDLPLIAQGPRDPQAVGFYSDRPQDRPFIARGPREPCGPSTTHRPP